MKNKHPVPMVDIIIEREDRIVLLHRAINPYKNKMVIPGGKIKYGEVVEDAAKREAKEETGLEVKLKKLFGVYSNPVRDPRFHSISIVFIAEHIGGKLKASFEGKVEWFNLNKIDFKNFGFDHAEILRDYISSRNS